MALGLVGVEPAVVVWVVRQCHGLATAAQAVFVDGQSQRQGVVLIKPGASVTQQPVAGRFAVVPGGAEYLDQLAVVSPVEPEFPCKKSASTEGSAI